MTAMRIEGRTMALGKTKAGKTAITIGALGIVFGDIGTSPLYALRECFAPERGIGTGREAVLGVVSLLIWSVSLVVCLKYLLLVVRADNRGEGGILALVSLVGKGLKNPGPHKVALLAGLGILGAALLYSDGIITPAISVLSAIEGLEVITPGLKAYVVPLALAVLVCLFPLQSRGTTKMGRLFGPVLMLWFAVIGLLGFLAIVRAPGILAALNPLWALRFLASEGRASFGVLGAVFLAMTGAEVLYADLGHFGRSPIRRAWFFIVYPALLLSYVGQGAFLLSHPEGANNLFFRLAPSWATLPLVILATIATIIASQAVISGSFSLASQSVQLDYLPRLSVRHTSDDTFGQVYVPLVNTLLLIGTVALVLGFRESSRLANAYGIAVSATMFITTGLMVFVALKVWKSPAWLVLPVALVFIIVDGAFFVANAAKIVSGGWIVVVLAGVIFLLMRTWIDGRALFRRRMRAFRIEPDVFVESLFLNPPMRVPGSAVFLTGDPNGVPKALLHNLKHNRILHNLTVIASVAYLDEPFVDAVERSSYRDLGHGLRHVTLSFGFREVPDVPAALAQAALPGLDLGAAAWFVGREDLVLRPHRGSMAFWRKKLFGFLFSNALDATDYFHLPANDVVEIGSQTEL